MDDSASKTMAVELAPFGIRVNVINPVAGETLLKSFLGEDTPEMSGNFFYHSIGSIFYA